MQNHALQGRWHKLVDMYLKPILPFISFPQELPLCALYFPSDRLLVGGGHEFNPMLFTGSASAGAEWTSMGFLDRKKADEAKASTSGVAAAR